MAEGDQFISHGPALKLMPPAQVGSPAPFFVTTQGTATSTASVMTGYSVIAMQPGPTPAEALHPQHTTPVLYAVPAQPIWQASGHSRPLEFALTVGFLLPLTILLFIAYAKAWRAVRRPRTRPLLC
jgi:hypothetical protein